MWNSDRAPSSVPSARRRSLALRCSATSTQNGPPDGIEVVVCTASRATPPPPHSSDDDDALRSAASRDIGGRAVSLGSAPPTPPYEPRLRFVREILEPRSALVVDGWVVAVYLAMTDVIVLPIVLMRSDLGALLLVQQLERRHVVHRHQAAVRAEDEAAVVVDVVSS